MTNITTLDLRRKDIHTVESLVKANGRVQVTHRGKPLFMLSVLEDVSIVPGSAEAKRIFLEHNKRLRSKKGLQILDSSKSIKRLYRESLSKSKKHPA